MKVLTIVAFAILFLVGGALMFWPMWLGAITQHLFGGQAIGLGAIAWLIAIVIFIARTVPKGS